ncbi:MAG: CBS domain-containing protein [Saprospiraceae bacterium]|nr:CBS domain-containing protein [Saprospiraceae bacterium]
MTVDFLIDNTVEVLAPEMTGDQALRIMGDSYSAVLPMLDAEGKLLAMVTEDHILSFDLELKLEEMHIPQVFPALNIKNHFTDAIRILGQTKLQVIPIVDDKLYFKGAVSAISVMEYLYDSGSVDDRGASILIEMKHIDYSMSELARLIESEQSKILSSFIFSDAASDVLQLSLRLNTADTRHVVATLERFGYKVFDFSLKAEQSDDRLRDHIDSFLSYLQI